MKRVRSLFFKGKFFPVLLEGSLGAGFVLLLVFSIVRDIPTINIPATFIFLVQAPVAWAALRLAPAFGEGRSFRPSTAACELAFALLLRAAVYALALGLETAFQAGALIGQGYFETQLNLVFFTACFTTFLLFRLALYAYEQWRRLARRSLLWTLVNSHLVVVFTLVAVVSLVARLTNAGSSIDKFVPDNTLAMVVLELVRSVIPWVGVSLILIVAAELAFLPPAFLVSFLTSRRFVQRIQALALAMGRARQGDLDHARVEPAGEDEIAQLQADFNHMAVQLQQEREKVDRLLKEQRELAAVVSHELRTPITVMRAYVEDNLLEEKPERSPQEVRKDLETVHHEILSLQALVEDLFTLSRLDAQHLELDCGWVDAAAVIQSVIAAHSPLAWKNKRIDLSADLPLALPRVWGDARRLEQALGNLAQNAIRHTPDGGVVVVSAAARAEDVEIWVLDSGEGIAPEDLPHVWDRFYRGGSGKSGAGRTGIGLSLVKELVEAMEGSVGVESHLGEGSRFWLRLPCAPLE
jgi:signal transduction histidine kinase